MNNGDFVKIDFELRAGEDKKLYVTNLEEVAKANDIYSEDRRYGESYGIIGTDSFLKKVNESLLSAEVGKEYEIEIPPEEAYGQRDPKNIRIHTVREFQRQNLEPEVGKEIYLGGRQGRIISVTPGRVMVDYNNRFAGKTVYYKYKVLEVLNKVEDKVRAILLMNYTNEASKFPVSVEGQEIRIEVSDESKFDHLWFDLKFRIVNEIRQRLPDYGVLLIERYPKTEKVETPTEQLSEPTETKEQANEESQQASQAETAH